MAETTDVAGQVVAAGIDFTKEISELVLRLGTTVAGKLVSQVIWKGIAVSFVGPLAWNTGKAVYSAIRHGKVTLNQLDKLSNGNKATIGFTLAQKEDGMLGRFTDYLHKMKINYAIVEYENLTYVMINEKDVQTVSPYLKQLGWESLIVPDKNIDVEGVTEKKDINIEDAGLFVCEKKSISTEQLKEHFGIGQDQADELIGQLEIVGLIEGKNHKVVMDKDTFITKLKEYQSFSQKYAAGNNVEITINKESLIVDENEKAFKTRVPGTFGENAKYIWVEKEAVLEVHNGKTLFTFLDEDKTYNLHDEENNVVATISGKDLYSQHYDVVDSSLTKKVESVKGKEKESDPIKNEEPKADFSMVDYSDERKDSIKNQQAPTQPTAEKALERTSEKSQRADNRPSVKTRLNEIKEEQSKNMQPKAPAKDSGAKTPKAKAPKVNKKGGR